MMLSNDNEILAAGAETIYELCEDKATLYQIRARNDYRRRMNDLNNRLERLDQMERIEKENAQLREEIESLKAQLAAK